MLAVIAILTALAVVLFALTLVQLRPNRTSVTARLDQIHPDGRHEVQARRRRQAKSERLMGVLQALGQQVGSGRKDTTAVRQFLVQAGYTDPNAVSIYWATRVSLAVGLSALAILGLPVFGIRGGQMLLGVMWLGGLGWVGPTFYVAAASRRVKRKSSLPWPTCSTCSLSASRRDWGSTRRWFGWPTKSIT